MTVTDNDLLCTTCLGSGEVIYEPTRDPADAEPLECMTCLGHGCLCHRSLRLGEHWTLCPINPPQDAA